MAMRAAVLSVLSLSVVSPAFSQVTSNDVRYAAERVFTQRDAYVQGGGDAALIDGILAEGKARTADKVAAYRAYSRGMVVAYGSRWTPESELATCLDFVLGAKLVGPGDSLEAQSVFLFDAPTVAHPPYRLVLEILDRDDAVEATVEPGITLGDVRGRRQGETIGLVFAPSRLVGPGVHTLRATLKNGRDEPVYRYFRSFALVADLDQRIGALRKHLELSPDTTSVGATTARFVMETIELARRSYLSGALAALAGYIHTSFRQQMGNMDEVMDYEEELSFANSLADAVAQGEDSLKGLTGNRRLAYRSAFDGKLMPYRVFIPRAYDPTKTYPLVVLLHGSGGDENAFLARPGPLHELAERRGYVLAAPNGRGPVSGYAKENGAQQDVMDVVAAVRESFSIDGTRIYLTGHSMGAIGTWSIGMAHRDVFAALAPMAGTGESPALDEALASGRKIPIMVACGGKDPLITAAGCRAVAEKATALGYPVEYVEYPDDNHWMVAASAIPDAFDFFDRHGLQAAR